MKTILRNLLAVAVLITFGQGVTQAQQVLYGLGVAPNTGTPTTFRFNLVTGEGTTVGALGDSAALPYGIAQRGDSLYTFDANTQNIRQISPTTGAFIGTPLNIGVGNVSGEGDLTFSLDGNTGYLTTAMRPGQPVTDISPGIYTFTFAGTSNFVATTADSLGPVTVDGMAFNPNDGLLYALTDADTRLYTLNPVTGFLTPVGELGVTPNGGYGALAFSENGTLYGAINNALYRINTTTGAATAVGIGTGTDFGNVSGAAFFVQNTSDLNNDGIADLFFQNTGGAEGQPPGALSAWYLDGTGNGVDLNNGSGLRGGSAATGTQLLYPGFLLGSAPYSDWTLVARADVNNDGIADLLFQNSAGQIYTWFLDGTGNAVNFSTGAGLKNGSVATSVKYLYGGALPGYTVVACADVNADGIPDIIFQNTGGAPGEFPGAISAWYLDGSGNGVDLNTGSGLRGGSAATGTRLLYNGTLLGSAPSNDWKLVASTDVDGDGIADLLFHNSAGQIYVWFLDGTGNAVDFSNGTGLKGGVAAGTRYLYAGGLSGWRLVASADANRDGFTDLLFQNSAGQIYVWLLDGTGNGVDLNTGAGLRGGNAAISTYYLYGGSLRGWSLR